MESGTGRNIPGADEVEHMAGRTSQRTAAYIDRSRYDDSWVEIASQPSSSSLSSITDEIVTTGLRVQDPNLRRKRRTRPNLPSHLNVMSRTPSTGDTSSQEEYEESESESDQVMTSSAEDLTMVQPGQPRTSSGSEAATDDEDDENRTAVNDPINNCFTPQPNAFSHPPSYNARGPGEQSTGSYFPATRPAPRPSSRHSFPAHVQHSPYNAISPNHNAAAHHDAALRASLSNLLSYAAVARGLPKRPQISETPPRPMNRVEPMTLRLVPESELPGNSPTGLLEPTFHPTIRRTSTSTSASASADGKQVTSSAKEASKRKTAATRSTSKDRRATKKRRASTSYNAEEMFVSPTLLTWVVSAGVVVVLSALSFSAGYSMGKEAGRIDAIGEMAETGNCAREAGRTGLGLRRLRFAVQA